MPIVFVIQKEMPVDQQLHLAALQGNLDHLRNILSTGEVHVDCKDKVSFTSSANSRFKIQESLLILLMHMWSCPLTLYLNIFLKFSSLHN